MSKRFRNSTLAKVVSGFTGVLMSVMMLGGLAVAPAQAQTVADLMAMIAQLQAQLNALSGGTTTGTGYTFAVNLKQGMTGTDVMNLQKVLNMDPATQIAQGTDAGAPGYETSYFGARTKAAVIKFQDKYTAAILTPVGLTAGTGFVGASTRAKLNSMTVGTGTGTGTTPTPTTGGLTVSNTTQPANSLMVEGSARTPFTKFVVSAGASDVTITGVTVERTGLANDAVFAGIVLLDEDGTQIGIAKTLGSNHQATVGDTFIVKAGTSKTLTVAGNAPTGSTSLDAYAGQVASLTVTGVNTTSTVSGSFPITGASHTINASLTIGSVTTGTSSFDPGSIQSKEIGTTGYKFSGIRITAGSAEAVRLKSIRFNQSGSASSNDLSNIMVYVDGVAYATTVSADGKYYTANLGSGIVMDKGMSKDIYIQGDITGTGAAGRTVKFDIYKGTDIYLVGETFNYGITAPQGTGTPFAATSPFFAGYTATVSSGSVTSITKATSVAAQNIALNVSNQVLGGYDADIKGESISVQSSVFHFNLPLANLLTSVSLYDANGAVVAGPVDAVADGTWQKVTFTDTVTYPIGKKTYTLKGKVPSAVTNGTTIIASSTPSTDWTSVTGQTTGNAISLSTLSTAVTMNTMTVRSAALAIGMSTSPAAQTIVAGGSAVTFANIQLDASQSGEDVRFSSIALTKSAFTGLTSCQLYDGTTALNTGSNVLNPAVTTTETITFDSSLTVAKNTVKTLTLKCNVSSSAVGPFTWTVTTSSTNPTVTGVTSGSSVTATGSGTSASMAVVSVGSLALSTSPSSPSYAIAAAGTAGNTASVLRFRATNEAVNLSDIGLTLTGGLTSAADLVQVSIWDGTTQIGTATFTGGNTTATSTLTTVVVLPKDADKDLTVKVDLATISGTTNTGGTQGALVKVNGTASTKGTGVSSGTTIWASGSTSVAGIRLYKSFPTFALDTLSSAGMADGRLMRFKVTANANGGIGLNQFRFTIATSTGVGITSINLYGYTDTGYSTGISGFTSGQIQTTSLAALTSAAVTIAPASIINIPAGSTYYFELRGTVTGTVTGSSVITTLSGDAAYTAGFTPAYSAGSFTMMATSSSYVLGLSGNNVLWSPNATTTSTAVHDDWTNSYGVVGLPSSGLIQSRSN